MRKLSLNNFKIRTKLLLIYALCVLLPIILTDAIILYTADQNSKHDKLRDLQHVMERIEYNLGKTVDACILFTSNIYTDNTLNDFLNKRYKDNIDYYDAYIEMLNRKSLSSKYNYGLLTKIEICADNNTMISGGKIIKLNSVKNSEWYRAFIKCRDNTFMYIFYDEAKNIIPGSGTSRTVSIIRKLDNFKKNGIEKILKVDLSYNLMLKDILNEQINDTIYVRNKDYIIFSNSSKDSSMTEYAAADSIDMKKVTISRKFVVANQEWEILILAKDVPFFDIITNYKGLIILVILNVVLPTLLIFFMGRSISSRLLIVADYMDKVKKEQFEVICCKEGEDEIGKLIQSYNLMVLKIKNLIEVVFKENAEKQALEFSNKQAELKAIQSQVNPHFLFNTLETIRMRSLIKNENETADIIGELAILFRKSMDWRSDFITIEEEMAFIDNYINIQKYRFGDKIKYFHYIMEECKKYKVPKLSIATFIENACVHGIETTVNEGIISVTITKDINNLLIEVSDNGKGFEEQQLSELRNMLSVADSKMLYASKNTGILNAFLRLKMYCDGNITFNVDSKSENGTDILIQMPLDHIDIITEQKIKLVKEESTDDQSNDC